jgi:membrane protease YdiL (CAAX protease family)
MSVSITTYPAQSPIFPARTSAASTLPWRFWSTLGWAVVASVIMARGWSFVTTASAWLQLNPAIVGYLGPIIPYAGVTAFLVLVARWRGPSAGAYLGLVWPRWYHIIISVALFVAFRLGLEALSSSPSGARASAESINAYRAIMGTPVALAFYWITAVVKAPVTEEIIVRGFLQRGWSESSIGTGSAIFLSTLVFALAHTQYDMPNIALVFLIGLVLSLIRWWTGSVLLTILLHASWNFTNTVQTALAA